MVFEYHCPKCELSNIFKQINALSIRCCKNCGTQLNVQKDLVRYERDKDGDSDIILYERVEKLVIAINDFSDRIEKLETQVFGSADDEEIVTVN